MHFSCSLWTYVISQISPLWSAVSTFAYDKTSCRIWLPFPMCILCNNIFNFFFFSSNNDCFFCRVHGGLFLAPESSSEFHSPHLKLKIRMNHLVLPCLVSDLWEQIWADSVFLPISPHRPCPLVWSRLVCFENICFTEWPYCELCCWNSFIDCVFRYLFALPDPANYVLLLLPSSAILVSPM